MFPGFYNEEKLSQATAYMLSRAGGTLDLLRLMKLLYLSERLSYQRYGLPLTGDSPHSMRLGPVLTLAYDKAKTKYEQPNSEWSKWMRPRFGNDISLRTEISNPTKEFRQLSDAMFGIISEIWEKFGHMSTPELVDWLHKYCPEWEEQTDSSKPISKDRFFAAIGFNTDEDKARIAWLESMSVANSSF